MRRVAYLILSLLAASGVALFGLAFYDRYWRWRDCFNELGRCWDSESQQVFLEQAGLVWGSFAAVCLLVLALSIWRLARHR